ncbi:MAG TPA: cytochrome P450 [Chloroflexota bacterium]|jgi:cytochrome P450
MTATLPRPDPVDIPESVWASNQLSPYIARIAEERGPIFEFTPRGGPHTDQSVIYMVGPEANRFVFLTGRDHFSHDQGWTPVVGETLGHGLLNMDPPEHTVHRALMNPAFTSAFMAGYLPLMQRVIADRTTEWIKQDTIDLMVEAREITFDVAAAALVGLRSGPEVDWLRERFYVLLRGGDTRMNPDEDLDLNAHWERMIQRQIEARDDLQKKLLELIETRRSATSVEQEDVLGMLVRAHDDAGHRLSDEQLLAHVNILLVAGHETTTTLGAWVLYVLAGQPEYAARIEAELTSVLGDAPITSGALHRLPFLSAVIRETGRLHSPVLLLPRGVLSDFEFAGRRVTAGTPVFLAIAAGHRIPSIWDDPERFDPDRFLSPREEDRRTPYALATFGGGPRICLGINFAQLEVMALIAHVQRHYRLSHVSEEPIREFGGLLPALPDGIPVRAAAR